MPPVSSRSAGDLEITPLNNHVMASSIEQYLLHAALLCGMNPIERTVVYRQQLFFVANRDLGSRNHDSDFQRALETAVDKKALFLNAEKGRGEYMLTAF